MAPLEGLWLNRRVEERTIYVVEEVTKITIFEQSTLSSPYPSTREPNRAVSPSPSHSAPPNASSTAKPAPESPTPVQTTIFTRPTNAPPTLTTYLLAVPTFMTTSLTAVGDQESDPSSTAPPVQIQSGGIGPVKGKETTIKVPTITVTSSTSTSLPNGQTSDPEVVTTTGMQTTPAVTGDPAQIGTISSKSGLSAGICAAIGAIFVIILGLIAFYIIRRGRRQLSRPSHVTPNAGLPIFTTGAITRNSFIPRSFFGISSPQQQPPRKREKDELESPNQEPHQKETNDQDNTDPFQDPETVQGQEESLMGARNALDRLQELTREVEEELRELGNRAQRGQLSDSERERLDEIRRTTGLTIVYDLRRGRFLTTSSTTSYSTSPPSYHSTLA